MQKTSETTSKRAGSQARSAGADAIDLLKADHDKVKKLFKDYEKLKESGTAEKRSALAAEICLELTVHAQVEEELFYPSLREAIDDGDLMDEAEVEHASAKDLIAQLSEMDPEDDLYDAKVKVLGEYVDHHVKEEEDEMFPKARKAKLDVETLGAAIATRKEELMEELADDSDDAPDFSSKPSGRTR